MIMTIYIREGLHTSFGCDIQVSDDARWQPNLSRLGEVLYH
jgi:hypothetical protein